MRTGLGTECKNQCLRRKSSVCLGIWSREDLALSVCCRIWSSEDLDPFVVGSSRERISSSSWGTDGGGTLGGSGDFRQDRFFLLKGYVLKYLKKSSFEGNMVREVIFFTIVSFGLSVRTLAKSCHLPPGI